MKRASFDDAPGGMEVICFRLPVDDYHALRRFAEQRGKTLSLLMRQVAAEFVALVEAENDAPLNGPKVVKPVGSAKIRQANTSRQSRG